MIDIAIHENGDGGELQIVNDDFGTVRGLTNQVYLALYGGNIEQSTSSDLVDLEKREDWWGNNLLAEENQFNSEFEKMLMNVALTSNGLKQLRQAAKNDLNFLEKYAEIAIEANITGINRFELVVFLRQPDGLSSKLRFIWDGTKLELIEQKII